MRVTPPSFPMVSAQIPQALSRKDGRVVAVEDDHLRRAHEHLNARALISSAEMSFDIDLGGNSITVTLTDRASGEAFRKLVYSRGSTLHADRQSVAGHFIDVTV